MAAEPPMPAAVVMAGKQPDNNAALSNKKLTNKICRILNLLF
jgi:hypothetical protein